MIAKKLFGNKNVLVFILFLLPLFTYALTPTPVFSYANKCGGSSNEQGNSVVHDGSGNVYVVGSFSGTVDFNPGAGSANLTAPGTASDIFIAKYDFNGNYVWAKRIGNNGTDVALSVATDVEANVYVCGSFEGAVDFDPHLSNAVTLTSAGNSDAFLLKLNMNGDYIIAHQFGSTSADKATSVTVDWDMHICLTGTFQGTCDFDPDPTFLPAAIIALTSNGNEDVFLVRLHADPSVTFLVCDFAINIGGTGSDVGSSVKTDNSRNVVITGYYNSVVDFDPGAGNASKTSQGNSDIFVARYSDAGIFQWVASMGGTGVDEGKSVTVDVDGNVYSTGVFAATVDFDPSGSTFNLTSPGGRSVFIHKLTTLGAFTWVKPISATTDQYSYGITLNTDRFVTVLGYFNGTADFDPGAGTQNISSSGIDIFIEQLDQNGNYLWAGKMGGTGTDIGFGSWTDGGNNIYVTGYFTGTCDFDASASTQNRTATGAADIFFTKYNQAPAQPTASGCLPLALSQTRLSSVSVGPNNNPVQKNGYQLIFNDEFITIGMNPLVWLQKFAGFDPLVHYRRDGDPGLSTYSYGYPPNDYVTISANYEPNYLGSGKDYTSGWMETLRKFKHGFFEIRAKMPWAASTWTSFWLYGSDFDELDILEIVSDGVGANNELNTTYHWRDHGYPNQPTSYSTAPTPSWQGNGLTTLNSGYDFANDFHTYGMEWAPGRLDFYLDNVLVNSVQNDCNVSENLMTLIVALTLGQYTPNVSDFTPTAQHYVVDYVRVYKKIWVDNYGYVVGGYGAEGPRMMADVTGDGKDDIVAFGGSHVYVSKANVDATGLATFSAPQIWVTNFYGYNGGWRVADHIRTTADMNGDGKADIVGFFTDGVWVALSTGTTFGTPTRWITNFGSGPTAGGWDMAYHPRMLADVNADGKADVVGFGWTNVWVCTTNVTGTGFSTPTSWSTQFCVGSSPVWNPNHPRILRDINADGKADIVGFGETGLFTATTNASSTLFNAPTTGQSYFGASSGAGSWTTTSDVRTLADVNGDGNPDVVGFNSGGIHVALGSASGAFATQTVWTTEFGSGWSASTRPRMMADLNGDGMDDVVGFGGPGVFVSFSNGFAFPPSQQWTDFYGADAIGGSFTVANHLRMTAEVNGDCRKDIVAFGDNGVFVTLSPRCGPYAYRLASETTTGVQYVAPGTIAVFPNPASGIVNITSGEEVISSLIIMDVAGHIIYEDKTGSARIEIDMSDKPDGMYVVRCVVNGEIRTSKFLKH